MDFGKALKKMESASRREYDPRSFNYAKAITYSSLKILNPDFSKIAHILKLRPKFHLLMSRDKKSIENLLANGWKYRGYRYPSELLPKSEHSKNILILPTGEFDDLAGGAIALGNPKTISQIFNQNRDT